MKNHAKLKVYVLVVTMLISGCAVQRYQPAPIVPSETAANFQARSLGQAGLRTFLETNLHRGFSQWPPATWDFEMVSLAALYFNPAIDTAQARVQKTQAAIVTAGARPNPTLSLAPGIPSPYLLSLDLSVPIETAGKRGHRIQFAQSLDEAARLDLADSAWKVRSGVRAALLHYLVGSRNLELLRSEEQIRADQVRILSQRFSVGEIPKTEIDLARIEQSKAHLAVSAAEGQTAEAKAALAASIGIPLAGLRDFDFTWPALETPPSAESLSASRIQRDAVLNRLDVRRSLAQYAAAEADLQLEIAKQYPDLQISPGYTYEERNNFFTIGISTTLPVFNRNQGGIAEAEARRKEAEASFRATQAEVIADSERALALYRASSQEFSEADQTLRMLNETQEQATEQAVRAGEEDQLALSNARIETSIAARARLDALTRTQLALGELEDAVQRPLASGEGFPPNRRFPPVNKPSKEPNQ